MAATEDVTYAVVPDGDVILFLSNANAPFAVWPGSAALGRPVHDETEDNSDGEDKKPPKVSFRLSSGHLVLASEYFKKILQGPWKENQESDDKIRRLTAEDWDEQAFLIVMNIIHSRSRQLPRIMDLELLAKITIIVDYYQCHESVQFHTEFWFNSIVKNVDLPTEIGREAILWLHISWVFANQEAFQTLTAMIQTHATKPVPSLDLPVHRILDEIELVRKRTVREVVDHLNYEFSDLTKSTKAFLMCGKEECLSMNLGRIIRHAAKNKLYPLPRPPYRGISFHNLSRLDDSYDQPNWYLDPPSSDKIAAIAKEASKKAYQDGYRAGMKQPPLSTSRNTPVATTSLFGAAPLAQKEIQELDGYNESNYRGEFMTASLVVDQRHWCRPVVFSVIGNIVSRQKCGFQVEDFDPTKVSTGIVINDL